MFRSKKIIKKMVNWKCKKKTIYQKKNLGLRDAIINRINFFFKNEKKDIIIEDSMLPSQSFFLSTATCFFFDPSFNCSSFF